MEVVTETRILPKLVFHVRVLRQHHVIILILRLLHDVVLVLEHAQRLDPELPAAVPAHIGLHRPGLRGVERARRPAGASVLRCESAIVRTSTPSLEVASPRRWLLSRQIGRNRDVGAIRQVDFDVAAVAHPPEPRAPCPRAHGCARVVVVLVGTLP